MIDVTRTGENGVRVVTRINGRPVLDTSFEHLPNERECMLRLCPVLSRILVASGSREIMCGTVKHVAMVDPLTWIVTVDGMGMAAFIESRLSPEEESRVVDPSVVFEQYLEWLDSMDKSVIDEAKKDHPLEEEGMTEEEKQELMNEMMQEGSKVDPVRAAVAHARRVRRSVS
jgi:hypothetical protein